MAIIENPNIRLFHLPRREQEEGGQSFGDGVMLMPQSKLEVPDWYLEALGMERNSKGMPTGWALRLERTEDGARVRRPRGAAGTFQARVIAKRAGEGDAEEALETTEPIELPAADDASTGRKARKGGGSKSES